MYVQAVRNNRHQRIITTELK